MRALGGTERVSQVGAHLAAAPVGRARLPQCPSHPRLTEMPLEAVLAQLGLSQPRPGARAEQGPEDLGL